MNEEENKRCMAEEKHIKIKYYCDGSIHKETEMLTESNVKHGWCRHYYPSGHIQRIIRYDKGILLYPCLFWTERNVCIIDHAPIW
jgi:antitoxin component YwqK of YwqJK toxin-antitoxin module